MTECQYLTIGSIRTFVERSGTGTPVLLVHTAGQSAVQWRGVLESPPPGYAFVAPDLPGHGRSAPVDPHVDDLAWYARWCAQLLHELSIERAIVVGCSIGGKIALELAVSFPDRILAALAMAADAHNTFMSPAGLRRSLDAARAPSNSDRTELATLACIGEHVTPASAHEIAQYHRREDPVVTTNDLIGWASQDLRSELSGLSCPVHIVVGEDDFWVSIPRAAEQAQRIPRGRFTALPGVGHYPMEELDDFSVMLGELLGDLERAAPD